MQRQFGGLVMQPRQVDLLERRDAPFDLEVQRCRPAFRFREVLIDRQVIVDAADPRGAAEKILPAVAGERSAPA